MSFDYRIRLDLSVLGAEGEGGGGGRESGGQHAKGLMQRKWRRKEQGETHIHTHTNQIVFFLPLMKHGAGCHGSKVSG